MKKNAISNYQETANQNHDEIITSPQVRMPIIRKTKDNKSWWGYEEKGTLTHYSSKCFNTAIMANTIEVPQIITNMIAMWPSSPTTGNIYEWKEIKEISALSCWQHYSQLPT